MFDKIATAFSVVALGASGYAVFHTGKIAGSVAQASTVASAEQKPGEPVGQSAVVDAAAVEKYLKDSPDSDEILEAYLRAHPEVMTALREKSKKEQRASKKQKKAQAEIAIVSENEAEIFNDGYSFVAGNPNGDVTVVEFSDYNCGFCKKTHKHVAKFVKDDGNIRLIIKELPVLGPGSKIAGRAALASSMQDGAKKYAEFNDALMKHRGSHSEASVLEAAASVGLDVKQLQIDMKSPEIDDMIRRTTALAKKLSIKGTPVFIIGKKVVRGFVPADKLKKLAAAARSS